tara:strand:- start:2969 stop:4867 length:1899 start_codon:yes stop_codon:yes gene_type:complete
MPELSKIPTEELLKLHNQALAAETSDKKNLAHIPTEDLLKMRDQVLETERPKSSLGDSFMRGAANAASFGLIDKATAGIGAGYQKAKSILGLRGYADIGNEYSTLLNRIQGADDAARKDNPKAYLAGGLTGGALTVMAPGAAANALVSSGKGALQLAGMRLAGAAEGINTFKGAGAIGALSGAGFSRNNPLESPEKAVDFAKDVGTGALTGVAAQGASKVIGSVLGSLSPAGLERTANVKTLKAAGYMGKDLKNMSEAEKQNVGQILHETGVVKAFDSLEQIVKKAKLGKESSGQAIGDALDSVDNLVSQAHSLIDQGKLGGNLPPAGKQALKDAVTKQFQFNMDRIGQRIENEIIKPNLLTTKSGGLAPNPNLSGEIGKLQVLADRYRQLVPTSMRQGNIVKGTQGKVSNFDSDSIPNAFKREVYDIIKTEIDNIVEKTGNLEAGVAAGHGNAIGNSANIAQRNKSILDGFLGSKRNYGALKNTVDVGESRLGQLQANREVSLTDTIAGAAGLATGNPLNAVAIGGLNKLGRQYGDSLMAVTARKASEIMSKAPKALGPFAGILEDAASQGYPTLVATEAKLMKDPDFQRIISNYETSQNAISRRLEERRLAPSDSGQYKRDVIKKRVLGE